MPSHRTALLSLGLLACSSAEPTAHLDDHDAAPIDAVAEVSGDYAVSAAEGALTVGKSTVQLRVTRGGAPATGLAHTIKIAPVMVMSKMTHGNPVPVDAVRETATPGTYDATLFFTMASVDASGNPAGQWKLNVAIGAEAPVSLDVTVKPAAGADTTHVMLKNASDTITAMGSPKPRNYALFRDTFAADRVTVFVATVLEGMMVWPPVTTGLKLTDALTIESLELAASTDGATWAPMTCDATARCTAAVALASSVKVKLKINGKDYTTDGEAPGETNGAATFKVTP